MCSTTMRVLRDRLVSIVGACIIISNIMNKEDELEKQDNVLLPNSALVVVWAILFSLAILVYFGSAIFQICFETRLNKYLNTPAIVATLLCFCILDTIVYINLGTIKNGKVIKNRYKNMISYFQSFLFITDCIVVLALILRFALGLTHDSQLSLGLSFLDLTISLKFFNVHRYNQMLTFYYFDDWSLLLYEFIKYVILLALLCHIVACGFFLLDVVLIEAGWYPLQDHWLISAQAMPNLYTASLSEQYLYSFYFSIATLSSLAYGDITPLNPTEVAFVVCILAFLLMFYVYIFTQIYGVVNWFNRKSIKIQEQRHKIAHFLKKFNITPELRGRIISEYEFREKMAEETNKDCFINDISIQLAQTYSSMPYKYDINKFMPRFIKNLNIQSALFYEALSEKFFTPEEYFGPLSLEIERSMYFVSKKVVCRTLVSGKSKLKENAEKDRWLGVNAFISSQFDANQYWHVETPTELTALSFTSLMLSIRRDERYYEKFMEHCHHVICSGGVSEDMNKCLVCWKEYHNSKYCLEYRPQINMLNGSKMRKSSRLNQIRQMIESMEIIKRQRMNRSDLHSIKIVKGKPLATQKQEVSTQVELEKVLAGINIRPLKKGAHEVVRDWPYYMRRFNIPKYENLVGVREQALANSLLPSA